MQLPLEMEKKVVWDLNCKIVVILDWFCLVWDYHQLGVKLAWPVGFALILKKFVQVLNSQEFWLDFAYEKSNFYFAFVAVQIVLFMPNLT